jgi:hypothetical protein
VGREDPPTLWPDGSGRLSRTLAHDDPSDKSFSRLHQAYCIMHAINVSGDWDHYNLKEEA